LAGNEKRTSKVIAEYLSSLGLEVKTGGAGYGIIGILKGGTEGKNIAWRADMDALPNNFPDDAAFKSKNKGIQHGCGHDVHMAIGLGIAEILSKNKESISGTVYFIFQPEEETFVGAQNMVESKLFSELNIDEIYALHVTALPVGQIMVKPNEIFAYQKRIQITLSDRFSKDDAKVLYNRIRNEMLRKKDGANPWEIHRAFDTISGLNDPNTAFGDYLFMDENCVIEEVNDQLQIKANLYETDRSNLSTILPEIEQIITRSEFKSEFISTSYIQGNPTVLNDEKLTDSAIKTINTIYGDEAVLTDHGQIPYFNDDFIYFQQKTPGVYFLLGGSNLEKGIDAMNHAPNFAVDEACIKVGVKSFSSLILERTNSE
jgi:metal-dependent amidase/aminoacylase/carboxypeptidase family protein